MAWAKQKSGRWQGLYRDGSGRERSAGMWPTKRRALNEAASKESTERLSPTAADSERITWAEWEPVWLAGRRVADSTLRHDRGRISRHVRPAWGDRRLASITGHEVQAWVNSLVADDGLSASSAVKCFHLLSGSLRAAVAARILPSSPCVGVSLPKRGPAVERYLSDSEVDAICDNLSRRDELVVRVLVGTGLRLGEAQGLHWDDVDLLARVVRVRWSWDRIGGRMKPPKSYAARSVPLGSDLAERLRVELERNGAGSRPRLPYEGAGAALPRSGLVFRPLRSVRGDDPSRPMEQQAFRTRFGDALETARVGGKSVPWARVHDLRHTYASRLVRAGLPIYTVRDLLGHQSVTTTERYSHLAGSGHDAVRAVLDASSAAGRADGPSAFADRLRTDGGGAVG